MTRRAGIVSTPNLQSYFQDAVVSAASNQKVNASDESLAYLVQLLVYFARPENLFADTPEGRQIQPLAMRLAEALESQSAVERTYALKGLGDFALFFAGYFSDYFQRRPVDIDYYIGMGGSAYSCLHSERPRSLSQLASVFKQLADQFTEYVDIIAEVGEGQGRKQSKDILRLYELWLKTGSRQTAKRLRELGVEPGRFGPGINALTH